MCKNIYPLLLILSAALFLSCGKNTGEKEANHAGDTEMSPSVSKTEEVVESSNKGIGPITSIELGTLDQAHAERGRVIFEANCTACHKIEKKFIGPAIGGVTERREPEWIMNMILNPVEMVAKDPIAKQLMLDSNMAMMANQNMTEEQTRAILEYFRSLDQNL